MKIDFKCWTWGMQGVEDDVNKAINLINTKDWTEEEAKIIQTAFKEIENLCEGLKESAWGDDA